VEAQSTDKPELFNLKLLEPTTTLTDYVLAVECLILGGLLLRNAGGQKSILFWATAFLLIGIAAAAGGTFHGFREQLGSLSAPLWKLVVYSIGLSALLMACATILATLRPPLQFLLIGLMAAKFVIFVYWASSHSQYKYVAYDGLISMGLIIILQSIALASYHSISAKWILAGTAISIFAAGIQISGLKLHRNLNNNDLYHIVQMCAMYIWYRGGLLLRDMR